MLMTLISVFLAPWVITCIHEEGVRSVLDVALLCTAKNLTAQGTAGPQQPCCA